MPGTAAMINAGSQFF